MTESDWLLTSLPERLENDRKTEKYTDFTIRSGDYTFAVHRVVIGTFSPVFNKMIGGGLQESTTKVLDLSADSPEHVENMIEFMYIDDYMPDMPCPLDVHLQMYLIGYKYDIKALMKKAADRMDVTLSRRTDVALAHELIGVVRNLWYEGLPEHMVVKEMIMNKVVQLRHRLMAQKEFRQLLELGTDFVVLFVQGISESMDEAYDGSSMNSIIC